MHSFIAAIFDMDGLLLDSEKLWLEAFQSTCAHFKLGDLSELFERCIGSNSEMVVSILRDGLKGMTDFDEFRIHWDDEHQRITEGNSIPLMSGVDELLGKIESLNLPMAVATSSNTERAKAKLRSSGILDYFDIIIGGDQVTRSKPDPEIYLKAASDLSLDPKKCLAFEDSKNGVKAAVAAGMTVVQIPDLVQPDAELLDLGHIVLDSLTDVAGFDFKANKAMQSERRKKRSVL